MFLKKNIFFLLMENLGAMAHSRYTGLREITDHDVLELHCSWIDKMNLQIIECRTISDSLQNFGMVSS